MDVPLWLYVTVSTVLGTLISAGINTAISYALYYGKEAETAMFAWPSTLAGDVVLTCIIGSIITWLVSGQITLGDMDKDTPLRITQRFLRKEALPGEWLPALAEASYRTIFNNDDTQKAGSSSWWQNFAFIVMTGALVGIGLVPVLGTVFVLVGYLAFDDAWTMKSLLLYKGVLGGVMGLLLQPLIVLLVSTKPPPVDDGEATKDTVTQTTNNIDLESSELEEEK